MSDSPTTLGAAIRTFARYPSPRILAVATATLVAARSVLGEWSRADLLIPLIVLAFWPIQEWLIHVFVLHYRPFGLFGRTIDFPVPHSHRAHHADPWNLDLVFIPTHVFTYYSIPLQLFLWLKLAPTSQLAATGLAIYFVLTLHYEWVHYLVHTRYGPRSRFYDRLWRNHRLHHCKNENYWFGVTMLGGDRLLRTAPRFETVATSATCRTLGLELIDA